LTLHVDEARSWFAATDQKFDLIQMSLIDTWAATGAGAFSLSENGLYTLEGWRVFMRRLSDHGVFTVSRWYNSSDANESARMIALAIATLIDAGAAEPRRHVFVATSGSIATLALAKTPLTREQLQALRDATSAFGFHVLVDPDPTPTVSSLLAGVVNAHSRDELDALVAHAELDLSVPTDNRPFFFSQLRFRNIPRMLPSLANNTLGLGVLRGNLIASIVLVLILLIASIAVVVTILLPLRRAVRGAPPSLVAAGTTYFALIGAGFMFAEISLLQYFGVFLGHPIYAMSVCLFSLILSTGAGSIVSGWFPLASRAKLVLWGLGVSLYLLTAQAALPAVFERMAAQPLPGRVAVALAALLPAGFLMGFGFPTGMALVERIDRHPTPWFWGINGATGVLASIAALMVGMAFGINVTMILAATCYLLLIPIGLRLQSVGATH
jgi:predicted membrane-bound spermidine synthase